jgi:CubicO group peptidase (beta-lactamase class C family)
MKRTIERLGRLRVLAAALCLWATACGGGTSPSPSAASSPQTALQEVLTSTRGRYGLPAVAGAVTRAGGLLDAGALGVRKLDESAAVTPGDRFHLGSNVKAMTATVIAMLVEQGSLAWGSRTRDVFPELAASFDPVLADVTLEQILAHRAGIVPLATLEEIVASVPALAGSGVEQRLAFSAWALARPPSTAPGQYSYSNGGYVVASAMAERASGEPWETLITTRLLQPLQIQSTFGWPAQDDPSQPWGHQLLDGRLVPHDPHDPAGQFPLYLWPAGNLSTSMADYARFLQLHLRGLRGDAALLQAGTFRKLHTPVGGEINAAGDGYALGWAVARSRIGGVTTSYHDGSADTFYLSAALQADRDVAAAVVTNAGGDGAATGCGVAVIQLLDRYAAH